MSRLYVSDLDGTLLLPDRTLGARTRAAITRFVAGGGLFTIATGRSAASAASILGDLALPAPAITHNGALLSDLGSGRIVRRAPLAGQAACTLYQAARRRGIAPVAYALAERGPALLVHCRSMNAPTRGYVDVLGRLHPTCCDDDGAALRELEVLSLILLDEPARLAALFAEECGLGSGLTFSLGRSAYTPGLGVGEVQAAAASKASAALALADSLGLAAGGVVAFGDNVNDLPLLRAAGLALCPPTATAEVLAEVRERIAPPADEGVAAYLEALLAGRT